MDHSGVSQGECARCVPVPVCFGHCCESESVFESSLFLSSSDKGLLADSSNQAVSWHLSVEFHVTSSHRVLCVMP